MKAGRAGSNPDGVAKLPKPTQPLRDFLRVVGEAVTHMNSTVVGLDAVEKGYEKPAELNISWNPKDRKVAAIKARRFVVESVTVRVCEALNQYIDAISKLPRFHAIQTKWSNNKTNASMAQKPCDIAHHLGINICFLSSGACLLVHWRNRVVHTNSKADLTQQQWQELLKASQQIENSFAGLSVERLRENFKQKKPTLKDISSLIAMTIRFVRKLDTHLWELSKSDLDALLSFYGLNTKIEKLESETRATKRLDSILRLIQSEAPGLEKAYREFYVT